MAQQISEMVRGNPLQIDRSVHMRRIIDAVGPDVIKYIDDFIRSPLAAADAPLGWITTLVEAGAGESTITFPDAVGGALLITSDANEDDGVCLQLDGESFQMSTAAALVYFRIKFKCSEATQSDFFVGLGITDTTPLGGLTDGVYFQKDDGAATFKATTEKDSTETNTAAVGTLVADTNITLEFVYEGGRVEFFVNGVSVAKHTANIPDDEALTPTIQFLAGSTVAKTMQIDEVVAIQVGR